MKICLYVLLCLGTSSLLAQTQSQNAVKDELTALEQQMSQMELKGSYSPQFAQDHLGRDLLSVWPMGFGGRDEFTKPDSQSLLEEKFENLKINLSGNTAIVDGTWYKKGNDPAAAAKTAEWRGFFMHVWVKRNKKWQLVGSAAGPLFHPDQIGN